MTEKPYLHGRDHRFGGADPVPDPRWIFITPISPATTSDPEYTGGDPLYPAFAGGWSNISSDYPPLAFRYLHGMWQITPAAITGGEGTPGSTVFTIPATYPLPTRNARYFGSAGSAGEAVAVFELRTTGEFVFINIVGIGSGSGVGGPGIFFDTLNSGDWLDVTATGSNPGNGLSFNWTGGSWLGSFTGTWENDSDTAYIGTNTSTTIVSNGVVDVSPGTSGLIVRDSLGNVCFAIHADGTVHIKTGGTIHADL